MLEECFIQCMLFGCVTDFQNDDVLKYGHIESNTLYRKYTPLLPLCNVKDNEHLQNFALLKNWIVNTN